MQATLSLWVQAVAEVTLKPKPTSTADISESRPGRSVPVTSMATFTKDTDTSCCGPLQPGCSLEISLPLLVSHSDCKISDFFRFN